MKKRIIKLIENIWFKLLSAIFIIVSSFYDLIEDITVLRKEHFLFTIGLLMMFKSIIEIIDSIKNASKKVIEDSKIIIHSIDQKIN